MADKFSNQEEVRAYIADNAGFLVISGVMKVPDFILAFEAATNHKLPRIPQGIEAMVDAATGYDVEAEMHKYVLAMFNFVYETEWAGLSDDDRDKLNAVGMALKG